MQIKSILHLSFSIFLSIFLLFLFCPFDVCPYLYLISYLPSSMIITFSFHREQKEASAVLFEFPLNPAWSPIIRRLLSLWYLWAWYRWVWQSPAEGPVLLDASQAVPPAPSPPSLNPNSSCSDANVITHFFQRGDAWSSQICSLIRPPGVCSRLTTLCVHGEGMPGSGAYAVHPAGLQPCFNSWSFLTASSPCRSGESLGCLGGAKRRNRVWQDLHHKLSAECSRLTLQLHGAFG